MKVNYILSCAAILMLSGGFQTQARNFVIEKAAGKPIPSHQATSRAPLAVTPVIENPQGRVQNYFKDSSGIYYYIMDIYSFTDKNVYSTIVWGDDNKVYFKNILSPIHFLDSYVEGTVDGNTITVPMNQTVAYSEAAGYGMNLVVMDAFISEFGQTFAYNATIDHVDFLISDDGTITLSIPGNSVDANGNPKYVIGYVYTDDNAWADYCDYTQTYRPMGYELTSMPDNLPLTNYVCKAQVYDMRSGQSVPSEYIVTIGVDNDTYYIRGLCGTLPESVVVATREGNTLKIAQDQYVGSWDQTYYIFTEYALDNPDYDPSEPSSNPFVFADISETYNLTINDDEGTIVSNSEGYLVFNGDPERFIALDIYSSFTLNYTESVAGTPSNPEIIEYSEDYAAEFGMNDFFFNFSPVSTTGNLLDDRYLYYTIYVNGQPVEFEQSQGFDLSGNFIDKYEGFPGKSKYVPVSFSNGVDMHHLYGYYYVAIYTPEVETVGVQMVYVYDDVETVSDIVTYDVATGETTEVPGNAGVESIFGAPVSTEYFNLSGVKVANPSKGIYLKKSVDANGNTKTEKLLKP